MWLCVVSHFQSLQELKELGFLDGGKGGGGGNDVRPFVMPAGSVSEGSEDGGATATEEIKSVNSGDEGSDDDESSDSDDDSDSDEGSDSDNEDVETPKDESDAGDSGGGGGAAAAAAASSNSELKY